MNEIVNLSERRKAAQKKAAEAAKAPPNPNRKHLIWFAISAPVVAIVLLWQPLWDLLT